MQTRFLCNTARAAALETDTHSLAFLGSLMSETRIKCQPFSAETQRKLAQPIHAHNLMHSAQGWVYLVPKEYIRMLNDAFGKTGWTIVPSTPSFVSPSGKFLYRGYCLMVGGLFVSEAIGDCRLDVVDHPNVSQYLINHDVLIDKSENQVNRIKAEVTCRYIALVRTCKDIGIASELWDPNYLIALREKKNL